MFTISYNDFIKSRMFTEYVVTIMPGMTLPVILSDLAKVVLNIDSKTAYVFTDKRS